MANRWFPSRRFLRVSGFVAVLIAAAGLMAYGTPGIPHRLVNALASAAHPAQKGGPTSGQTKEEMTARMIELDAQITTIRDKLASNPKNQTLIAQLNATIAEYDQISAALGGDRAPATGSDASYPGLYAPNAIGVIPPAGSGCVVSTSVTSNSTPVAISASGTPTVTSTVTVAGAGPVIWDVNLRTFITHTFCSDLDITLMSPAGTIVTLTTDNGGVNDNVYNGTVWDDDANPGGQVPYSTNNGLVTDHAYVNLVLASPLAPEEPLAAFRGENPNGTWTLTISDDSNLDGGSLNSWDLEVSTLPAAPTTAMTTVTNSTPVAISASGTPTVTSTVSVAAGATIHKVRVTTNITHTFCSDLDITLMSPAGTVVTLTTDNGGVNDNVYNGTLWDDNANPGGQVPYTTNNGMVTDHAYVNLVTATPLTPEEPLGAFIGENPNGTWTLTISDDSNLDGGSLNSWSLEVTTSDCSGGGGCTSITCPPNQTKSNDPNQCGAVVTYPAPTPNGTCGTITCSPASGSFFPVGTTTVTCTSSAGPTCTFTVTVNDTQPPSITCPANITKSNDPNQCGAVVTYPPPTITDNCPGTFTSTCTPASGSFFPVGTTTVTCSVNLPAAPVTEAPAACVNKTITHSSSQTITPLNSVSCNDGFGHTDNSYWRAFNLPAFSINGVFNVSSVDVGIEEATSGVGTAPAKPKRSISRSTRSGKVKAPGGAGTQPITIRLHRTTSGTFPTGTRVQIATATFNVADQAVTIVNFPIAAAVPAGSELIVEVFTPNGQSVGNLFFIGSNSAPETGPSYLSAADCGVPNPTTTAALGFPNMHIVMNVKGCEDVVAGGPTCTFTVTVQDTQPPTITCPPNQTAVAPQNVCNPGGCVTATFPPPTASDNCPGVTTVCNPPSGSCFPLGTTTVTCTATDASGNTATCSFTETAFDVCIQDDSNPANQFLGNSVSGAYRFCCNGTIYTGVAKVLIQGCIISFNQGATDRRVRAITDKGSFNANASLESPPGSIRCNLTDREIRNNTCNCGGAPPPQ